MVAIDIYNTCFHKKGFALGVVLKVRVFFELGDCLSITHLLQDNLKKGTQIGTKKNSHPCYVFISMIILISMF